MDEQKTRDALDVLGDLYLTGGHFSETDSDTPAGVTPPVRTPPGGTPPPARLSPTLSEGGTRPQVAAPTEDTPSAADDAPSAPIFVPGALEGEVVVLGNLPVLARPWLSQYARNIAEHDGSVVVAHITGDDLDLEVVAPGGQSLAAIAQGTAEPSGSTGSDRLAKCMASFQRLGRQCPRRCLIHVDPSQIESLPDWLRWIGRWTLLTGADEAAVQATVCTIATLLSSGSLADGAEIGVALAGCGSEEAEEAAATIDQAARDQLPAGESVRVTLRDTVSRMVPLRQELVGTFDFDDGTRRMLGRLTATAHRHNPTVVETASTSPGSPAAEQIKPTRAAPPAPVMTVSPEVAAADDVAMTGSTPEPVSTSDAAPARMPDSPPSTEEVIGAEPDLIALGGQRLEGAVRLEARCPYDPDIQLALDHHGVLCLILLVRGEDPSPALARLVPMRQWTMQHLPLLQLTKPDHRFDQHAAIAAHLFTDQPRVGAELATRCGDALCVHLLARVGQDAAATWYSAELS